MALGKNLKRQQLIPTSSDDSESTTVSVNKKTKRGVTKNVRKGTEEKLTRPKSTKKEKSDFKPVLEPQPAPVDVTQINEEVSQIQIIEEPSFEPKNQRPTKYLTASEFKKRQELKGKFDEELKNLAGKKVQLIVFELGDEEYAFDLAKTREVVTTPAISKMPYTPEYIKGVTDIRGMVIEVFDLAQKFNLSKVNEMRGRYTMVMENDQFKVGILVEKVPATLIIKGEEIKSASGIVADTALDETYIKGIIKIDNRMIFYVDIDELIESDKVSLMPDATMEKEEQS